MQKDRADRESAAPFTYAIEAGRRLVYIQVRENLSPDDVVRFYAQVFSDPGYHPGFAMVVDRRGVQEPPSADTVRAVVEYLRLHAGRTGVCRMAVVTDDDAPRSAWRGAEMLAGHYTSVELRVFDDCEAAELWATRGGAA